MEKKQHAFGYMQTWKPLSRVSYCYCKMIQAWNDWQRILAGNKVCLSILTLLQHKGKLRVCDLSDVLGMTMAAVSQHLRKLKDGGFVRTERVGQTIFYHIREEQQYFLDTLFSFLELSETKVSS